MAKALQWEEQVTLATMQESMRVSGLAQVSEHHLSARPAVDTVPWAPCHREAQCSDSEGATELHPASSFLSKKDPRFVSVCLTGT
jgi:hypothetical protein